MIYTANANTSTTELQQNYNRTTTEDYQPGALCGPAGGRGLHLDAIRDSP
jgi:hypothetical protein